MSANGERLTCPACGARIYSTDQQCLACGARLDEGRLVAKEDGQEAVQADMPAVQTAWPIEEGSAAERPSHRPETPDAVPYATSSVPWHPERVTGGRGFFDSLSRGWIFLRESFVMAFRDKDLFLPSLFSVLANLVLLGGLGLILYLTGNLEPLLEDEGISPLGWVILIVMAFVGYLVTYFFTGMTVHLVDVHLRGKDAQLGSAFADCVRNIGGITALALVSLAVALLASAIRGNRRRGLRDAAADVVERAWLAVTYLLLPIMILEDVPFTKSVERARSLHRHNLVQIVVGELGLMLTSRIISVIMTIIGIGIAVVAYFIAPPLLPVGIGIALLLFVLAAAFVAYVRTAFYTCLYLWAAAMETVGETAPAPAPLQPALQAGW